MIILVGYYGYHKYQDHLLHSYYHTPNEKDIYIFKFGDKYAPYYLDTFKVDTLFFFSSKYEFTDALPKRNQIIDNDFIFEYYHVYVKKDLDKFFENKTLVKIYR